jgi:hypothetical protein
MTGFACPFVFGKPRLPLFPAELTTTISHQSATAGSRDASTTTHCEIDNLDVRVYFAELLTPALHYKSGKGGTSRIQLRKLRVSRKNRSKDGRERKSDPE